MPASLRTTSVVAFGAVAAVLLVVSAMSYHTVRRANEANQLVAHTYQVLNALEGVLTTMVDAETGTRGYGATGLDRYLEPFNHAQAELTSNVDAVTTLAVDNPVQQRQAVELRVQATATMLLLQQMVSLRHSNQPIPLGLLDREKAGMDALRATMQRMRLEAQRLMEQGNLSASRAASAAEALLLGLVAAAFGVLAMSFLFVDRRSMQLRQMNESLSDRVHARTAELETALVSERNARRDAEHAEQRFKQMVEGAPTAMVAVDRQGTIVLVNVLTERLFGYAPDEVVGKSVEMLVPERFRVNHSPYRADFSDAPQTRRMGVGRDLYGVRKDGREVPIEIALNPIRVDGETLVLSSIVDITDRKQAENERARLLDAERRARADADAASHSKDVFVARVSHELRTPLSALMGWTRVLQDGQLDPITAPRAIAAIDRIGDALKTLVEDLVDMSRISHETPRLDRRPLDVVAVVRESVSLLEPAANEKDIRLELDVDSSPLTVAGDPTRLRQVFWNLLSNAIKFTPTHGRVAVRVVLTDGEVEISVVDNGQGIVPEFLPHVFEPFSQADGGGRQGLGLGLAITHHFVQAHDGRVTVMSPGVGNGTTFTVFLPVMRGPESA